MSKSKVYFSPVITPEKVLEMYELLDVTLPGNVAVKVHSGERGNQNFIRPDFWKPIIDRVGGTVVEGLTSTFGIWKPRTTPLAEVSVTSPPMIWFL